MWNSLNFITLTDRTFEPPHDKTNNVTVRPAKTQISLGIRPVWSESSLCAQWVANDPRFLHVDSEDSDQTGRMPRLIWVFTGCTVTLLVLSCRGSFVCRIWFMCRKTVFISSTVLSTDTCYETCAIFKSKKNVLQRQSLFYKSFVGFALRYNCKLLAAVVMVHYNSLFNYPS